MTVDSRVSQRTVDLNDHAKHAGGRWSRPITGADLRADGNAFTIVRVVLATLVIFSHAFILTGHGGDDFTRIVLPAPVSAFAVLLFFSLSGFLVTGGLIRRGALSFAVARALRLLPGLSVMLLVTAAAGAFFVAAPIAAYLGEPSLHRYLWRNLALLGQAYSIVGVFPANPDADLVNGSLWTIPREVQCYLGLAVAGAIGLLRDRRVVLIAFIVLVAAHLIVPLSIFPAFVPVRRLFVSFASGVVFYQWHDRVRLSWLAAVATIGCVLLLPKSELQTLALFLAATYTMFVAAMTASASIKRISSRLPDYSYGIYIYAFPVQQAVIATHLGLTPVANMLWTIVIVVALAAVSWHCIERPALALKPRFRRRTSLQTELQSASPPLADVNLERHLGGGGEATRRAQLVVLDPARQAKHSDP